MRGSTRNKARKFASKQAEAICQIADAPIKGRITVSRSTERTAESQTSQMMPAPPASLHVTTGRSFPNRF